MEENLEKRVSGLESWKREIEIARAKEEVDRIHIDKRFDALENQLNEIKNTAKQLTYLVGSTIIVYIISFALNGGFSILKIGG